MVSNPGAGHICEGRPQPAILAEQVLNTLKDKVKRMGKRPRVAYRDTVLLDFESAALTAFGDVFPEAQVKGCLFHYSQAVQRNIG